MGNNKSDQKKQEKRGVFIFSKHLKILWEILRVRASFGVTKKIKVAEESVFLFDASKFEKTKNQKSDPRKK